VRLRGAGIFIPSNSYTSQGNLTIFYKEVFIKLNVTWNTFQRGGAGSHRSISVNSKSRADLDCRRVIHGRHAVRGDCDRDALVRALTASKIVAMMASLIVLAVCTRSPRAGHGYPPTQTQLRRFAATLIS